jgi:hypothetical protein
MGVATSLWQSNVRLGDDGHSWALRIYDQHANYDFTGLRHGGVSRPYHKIYPVGTRVGALLDLDVGTLEYVVNGEKKGRKQICQSSNDLSSSIRHCFRQLERTSGHACL